MTLLPNTLLAYRVDNAAILIGPNADRLSKLYPLPYHGYTLQVGLIQWDYTERYARKIVVALGGRITFCLIP